jgi:ABC-type branched-subunit amino acid transport system permease subunit
VLEEVVRGYLPANSVIAQGFIPAFPFIVLVLVLLFWPGLRRSSLGAVDPLASVDPPPPVPAAVSRPAWATAATRAVAIGALLTILVLSLFVLDSYWLTLMTEAVIYGVVFLSITTVTGMGGQISLCQAAFAGVGAFTAYQLVTASGASVLLGMLVGAVIAAAIGAVVAIPALRLEGVYVALATIAFGLVWDNVLVNVSWIGGPQFGLRELPRPVFLGIDFANNHAFFLLCVVVLALAAGAVVLIRGGTTGHFLDAVRGSERAAASVGIDTTRAKITAFAISGALAGLGGALLAIQQGQVNNQPNYVFQVGLFWVVIVVTLGMRSVTAAIMSGFAFALVPELLSDIGLSTTNAFLFSQVLFGLGVITYAKYPEGILEANTRTVLGWVERLRTRDEGGDRSPRRDTEEREPEPAALSQHPARTPS